MNKKKSTEKTSDTEPQNESLQMEDSAPPKDEEISAASTSEREKEKAEMDDVDARISELRTKRAEIDSEIEKLSAMHNRMVAEFHAKYPPPSVIDSIREVLNKSHEQMLARAAAGMSTRTPIDVADAAQGMASRKAMNAFRP